MRGRAGRGDCQGEVRPFLLQMPQSPAHLLLGLCVQGHVYAFMRACVRRAHVCFEAPFPGQLASVIRSPTPGWGQLPVVLVGYQNHKDPSISHGHQVP